MSGTGRRHGERDGMTRRGTRRTETSVESEEMGMIWDGILRAVFVSSIWLFPCGIY